MPADPNLVWNDLPNGHFSKMGPATSVVNGQSRRCRGCAGINPAMASQSPCGVPRNLVTLRWWFCPLLRATAAIHPRIIKGTFCGILVSEGLWCHACCGYIQVHISG